MLGFAAALGEYVIGLSIYGGVFAGGGRVLLDAYLLVHVALGILLTYVFAKWYFKDLAVPGTSLEGLRFGVGVALLRLVLGGAILLTAWSLDPEAVLSFAPVDLITLESALLFGGTLLMGWIVGWEEKRHRAYWADVHAR